MPHFKIALCTVAVLISVALTANALNPLAPRETAFARVMATVIPTPPTESVASAKLMAAFVVAFQDWSNSRRSEGHDSSAAAFVQAWQSVGCVQDGDVVEVTFGGNPLEYGSGMKYLIDLQTFTVKERECI